MLILGHLKKLCKVLQISQEQKLKCFFLPEACFSFYFANKFITLETAIDKVSLSMVNVFSAAGAKEYDSGNFTFGFTGYIHCVRGIFSCAFAETIKSFYKF